MIPIDGLPIGPAVGVWPSSMALERKVRQGRAKRGLGGSSTSFVEQAQILAHHAYMVANHSEGEFVVIPTISNEDLP